MISLISLFLILTPISYCQQRFIYVGITGVNTYVSNPECTNLHVDWKNGTRSSYTSFGNIRTEDFHSNNDYMVVRQEGLENEYSCLAKDYRLRRVTIKFIFIQITWTTATGVTLPLEGTVIVDGAACVLTMASECRFGERVEDGFKVFHYMLDTNTFVHYSPNYGYHMYKLMDERTVVGRIQPFRNCNSQQIIQRNTLDCDRTSGRSCLKTTTPYTTAYEFKPGNDYELVCRMRDLSYHKRFITVCAEFQRIENGQCVGDPNTNYIMYNYRNVRTTFDKDGCAVMVINGIRCPARAYCPVFSSFTNNAREIELDGQSPIITLQCLGNADRPIWTATVIYVHQLVDTPEYAEYGYTRKLLLRSGSAAVWRKSIQFDQSISVYEYKLKIFYDL